MVQPSYCHTHTVVFLHGRGDTAINFLKSLPYSRDSQDRSLADLYPSFRWVFPWAAKSRTALNGELLSQWFDIWNVNDFSDKEELQGEGLKDSVGSIIRILVSEADALGGHWDRLVLMGISQGAATSVHTMLHLHHQAPRLGAFVGFSCRMPFSGRTLEETRKALNPAAESDDNRELLNRTPMLLEHCVDDPLVLVKNGRTLRDTLRGFGADVTWKEYPDGGHWLNSPQGMDDAVEFINGALGLN